MNAQNFKSNLYKKALHISKYVQNKAVFEISFVFCLAFDVLFSLNSYSIEDLLLFFHFFCLYIFLIFRLIFIITQKAMKSRD